ncbi:MarR family winged helix-turn-helix transcriptional regulator [Kitasatospora sp. SUK 42]|uniref:MarR family winged helix-turn-helix transcriptional regulator n=1 Tax=Kitasatospora sp. SUK 42 TaxID=1588882 RepID=UPI001C3152B8|nr:MarR family winged helix-turn-helix transcriptional regulator [Kitasatospora sp. SUK 42]MBV2156577.1 MarR family winged helix-turn-helix transcriptional regulator [Kitasatospora sp. SUK 42]
MSEFMDVYTRASKLVRGVTDAAMRRHGLHLGQNLVLAALWEADGQTPGAIAATAEVTTPTIVKMANRMSAAGLVVRRRDDRDNRLVRLYLTDAGRALRGPIENEMKSIEAQLTAGLDESEAKALMAVLGRVADNARAQLADPVIDC